MKSSSEEISQFSEYLQWYMIGILEILSQSNDIKFHQKIRQYLFNKAKEYNDETLTALLTINKIDIDRMGM